MTKLKIELIPRSQHGKNLRTIWPREMWDVLRRYTYAKAGGKCSICNSRTSKLEAHEVWEFDVAKEVQSLKMIEALCELCHLAKHMGRATLTRQKTKALKHLASVNKISIAKAEDMLTVARFKPHLHRGITWTLDITKAEELYKEAVADLNKYIIIAKNLRSKNGHN